MRNVFNKSLITKLVFNHNHSGISSFSGGKKPIARKSRWTHRTPTHLSLINLCNPFLMKKSSMIATTNFSYGNAFYKLSVKPEAMVNYNQFRRHGFIESYRELICSFILYVQHSRTEAGRLWWLTERINKEKYYPQPKSLYRKL